MTSTITLATYPSKANRAYNVRCKELHASCQAATAHEAYSRHRDVKPGQAGDGDPTADHTEGSVR
jgi:hypothetical protein